MGIRYTADDFQTDAHVSAAQAMEKLKAGNRIYVEALDHERDLSSARIQELFECGQEPFACVITCSDSRVVPEHIFMAGLGELFVIRAAGNVLDAAGLASVVYACEHLRTKLVLVLGHTHCGAIKAALDGESGAFAPLTSPITDAIRGAHDPYEASVLNTRATMSTISHHPALAHLLSQEDLEVRGAIYHTHCGVVDFLEEEGCTRA